MTTRQQPSQHPPETGLVPGGGTLARGHRAECGQAQFSPAESGARARGEPNMAGPAEDKPAEAVTSPAPLLGRAGRALELLFPQAPARSRSRPAGCWIALASLAAVAVGALVQLERQTGVPAWQSLWAEDHRIFLPQALEYSPWSTLVKPYDGYVELLPRLVADVVARLPILAAGAGFAIAGALVCSGVAVFAFHASSGHIRRPELRVLLAVSVLLLPTALVEIANNTVNTPWYLCYGVFWALLWRPRGRVGMLAAACVCFAAASTLVLVALFAPLVAARMIALPRARQHAATLGLLAGGLVQVPALLTVSTYHQPTTAAKAFAFLGRGVILPTVAGHHLAELLWGALGLGGATLVAVCIAAAVVAWMLVQGDRRVRAFVLAALVIALLLCLVPVLIHGDVANVPPLRTALFVKGSRYGQVPILILGSALIVAVDAFVRRTGIRFERVVHVTAVAALVAALGVNWVGDYRYANDRTSVRPWSRSVVAIRLHCQRHPGGHIRQLGDMPCSRLRS